MINNKKDDSLLVQERRCTMERKIVFFDIDGTLYQYGNDIAESTITAIKGLKENGHIPVICTGRTKSMIFDTILNMDFDSLISGGGTYAEYKGKELYLYEMEKEKAVRAVKAMQKYEFIPIPEGHRYMYIDKNNIEDTYRPVFEIYQNEISDRIRQIDFETLQISKISGAIKENSDIEGIKKELDGEYTFVNHGGSLFEMIPKPFSKAVGIERMIEYLGIPVENTYAFGDSFNDLEMLTYVKYGVAMGNSNPELFKYVKYKTDSIEKNGIYNGLKRFGLI